MRGMYVLLSFFHHVGTAATVAPHDSLTDYYLVCVAVNRVFTTSEISLMNYLDSPQHFVKLPNALGS